MFFNVCITRTNMDDVRALTEMAKDYDIGIDYHIVESPIIDAPHFKHLNENSTFLTPADYPRVDELIDWILEKHKQGYKIVNQKTRLHADEGIPARSYRAVGMPRRPEYA